MINKSDLMDYCNYHQLSDVDMSNMKKINNILQHDLIKIKYGGRGGIDAFECKNCLCVFYASVTGFLQRFSSDGDYLYFSDMLSCNDTIIKDIIE